MDSYEIFSREIPEVLQQFPKLLQVRDKNEKNFIRGEIDVIDNNGKLWETFEVEIHHVDGFPFKFPKVYEVGGKIPRIADWHIYENTHACCLTVPPQEIIKCCNGISLIYFLKNEVLPYFFNQTHRMVEGYYVHGEYSHGYLGILEFFETELQTNGDTRRTIELLLKIATIDKPGRTTNCFCGKKKKYRRCHRSSYEKLITLGKIELLNYANLIAKDSGNFDLSRH